MSYGERLKKLRESKKLSQQQLADKLSLNRSTYARYELSQTQPDYATLEILADFYEVSVDYILGRAKKDILPKLTSKDEKDIAKKLENIINSMESDTALSFDGEPMDEETKELVRAAIESNLILTKQLAKKKFTPKKYRKE